VAARSSKSLPSWLRIRVAFCPIPPWSPLGRQSRSPSIPPAISHRRVIANWWLRSGTMSRWPVFRFPSLVAMVSDPFPGRAKGQPAESPPAPTRRWRSGEIGIEREFGSCGKACGFSTRSLIKLCSVPALPINGQVPRRSQVSREGNRDISVSGNGRRPSLDPWKHEVLWANPVLSTPPGKPGMGRWDLVLQLTRGWILLMKEGGADPVYKISETSKTWETFHRWITSVRGIMQCDFRESTTLVVYRAFALDPWSKIRHNLARFSNQWGNGIRHTGTCRIFVSRYQLENTVSWETQSHHGRDWCSWGRASWMKDNIDKALVVLFPKVQLGSDWILIGNLIVGAGVFGGKEHAWKAVIVRIFNRENIGRNKL